PKARHNALSHSGAIAVIAPDRLVIAIRSTRCTNSGHSARPRWSYQIYYLTLTLLLLQYNHLSCLQFFFNPHKTTIT
ncbi:hypothetical protein L249_7112, partial [Ophiocordyceps polyrhachis-furcata BCC 54312]